MSFKWLSVIAIFALCLLGYSFAQLTFTPVWGKRAPNPLGNMQGTQDCRISAEGMMLMYRLIQTEAQKLLECSQK
ncbi:hypertrehalosaemic prohormone [Ctenocephalides felis]|uniref:hypertrehalosaemic prohormone n=1 Tax=Ctenocephalides felis TaxID=7515 RepID=UPI000E6E21FC|nr:hypertrehalosaemic prohormone [Ctenocephalides felis]